MEKVTVHCITMKKLCGTPNSILLFQCIAEPDKQDP